MDNPLTALLHSRKFWLTVFGLVQTVVFQFFPSFPREVWMAIDALVAVLIGSIAYEDAAVAKGQFLRQVENCGDAD